MNDNLLKNYFGAIRNVGLGNVGGVQFVADPTVYWNTYLTIYAKLLVERFQGNLNVNNLDISVLDEITRFAWIGTMHAMSSVYPVITQGTFNQGASQGQDIQKGMRAAG